MNRVQFQTCMDRMTATYGAKSYPKERLETLWNCFGQLSYEDFSAGVSGLIAKQRFAPMLDMFYDELRAHMVMLSDKQLAVFRFKNEGFHCKYCDNTGSATIVDKSEKHLPRYAYKCRCRYGEFFFKNTTMPEIPRDLPESFVYFSNLGQLTFGKAKPIAGLKLAGPALSRTFSQAQDNA